MKLLRTMISIGLIALGFYIIVIEQALVQGSLRDGYQQLSEESKHSSVGHLLWTSHGVHHLFFLGSLVWILASLICLTQRGSLLTDQVDSLITESLPHTRRPATMRRKASDFLPEVQQS